MHSLRELLPSKPLNYGVLLRWTLALHEMEVYNVETLSQERNQIMAGWASGVRNIVQERGKPLISLLEEEQSESPPGDTGGEDDSALSTIISFVCRCRRGGPLSQPEPMTTQELRMVQYLMATDLAQLFPDLALIGAACERCFIGQPVCLNPKSVEEKNVLRVAASAPLVVQIRRKGLASALAQDRVLFQKLSLILGSWSIFSSLEI